MRLFAILGTWMEEDVVGACVRNAIEQGCERVYVVDNDSPDGTISASLAAGATSAVTFSTRSYDERFRISLMQAVVDHISRLAGEDHLWWLWLDADEFPHGPGGLSIREYLATLDSKFRIVGARCFNHYPTSKPQYVPGYHPLEFQPMCEEYVARWNCPAGHRKHPLIRVDRDAPVIRVGDGFHQAQASVRLIEPELPLLLNHFPYRVEETTRLRLARLCATDGPDGPRIRHQDDKEWGSMSNSTLRYLNVDAVYRGQWNDVREWRGAELSGVDPRPWADLVPTHDAEFARWYGSEELAVAAAEARGERKL